VNYVLAVDLAGRGSLTVSQGGGGGGGGGKGKRGRELKGFFKIF